MKKQRFRIYFSKTEQMRYTGHLDLILTWERTFRRSGLPLSYSEGFSPRPVLNMAASFHPQNSIVSWINHSLLVC